MYKEIMEEKRFMMISISEEDIIALFNWQLSGSVIQLPKIQDLPNDALFIRANYNHNCMSWDITVGHDLFAPVGKGCAIPYLHNMTTVIPVKINQDTMRPEETLMIK